MARLEIWKNIKGYEGLYQISNMTRIKSLRRTSLWGIQKITLPERILKTGTNEHGYLVAYLNTDGRKKNFLVHRLLADAFLPKVIDKNFLNHKNGNKLDNRLENLEWCTISENAIHAYKTGLKLPIRGERHKLAKLSDKKVLEMRKLRELGATQVELSKMYNVSRRAVRNVLSYLSWKHI